jgi:hypothetical protein
MPSVSGIVFTKMQSYRGAAFRQDGVARMYSRRIPLTPLISLGARKVAVAE